MWTFDVFQTNVRKAGVDAVVEPIVKTSQHAARDFDMPIELVFIDGAHEYEMVRLDFELWTPRAESLADTIEREAAWAESSVAYLRRLIPA